MEYQGDSVGRHDRQTVHSAANSGQSACNTTDYLSYDSQDTYNNMDSAPRDAWEPDRFRPDSFETYHDARGYRSYSRESSQSVEFIDEIHYDSEHSESSQRQHYSDRSQEHYSSHSESSKSKSHSRRKYGLIHEVPLESTASGTQDYGRTANRERDKSPGRTHRSEHRHEERYSHSRREREDRYCFYALFMPYELK